MCPKNQAWQAALAAKFGVADSRRAILEELRVNPELRKAIAQDAIDQFKKDNPQITANFINRADSWKVMVYESGKGSERYFSNPDDVKDFMLQKTKEGVIVNFIPVQATSDNTIEVYAHFADLGFAPGVDDSYDGWTINGWKPKGDWLQASLWVGMGHISKKYGGGTGYLGSGAWFGTTCEDVGNCADLATEWAKARYE